MIIKNLQFKEGINTSFEELSPNSNLLYSVENSVGKTTYIRLMLYAMGYQIPDTYGLEFSKVECKIILENKGKTYTIFRRDSSIELIYDEESIVYSLPREHNNLLMTIFESENINIIKNIFGIMYIDQEKGWTLLNRGTVIGRNKFNIEELVSGLANIDVDSYVHRLSKLEFEYKKYKSLLELSEIQDEVLKDEGQIVISDYEQDMKTKIAYQKYRIEKLKNDVKDITNIIKKNGDTINLIEKLKLHVCGDNGELIPVNRHTIKNLDENNKYLIYQKNSILYNLAEEEKELKKINDDLNEFYKKNNVLFQFDGETSEKKINSSIMHVNLDVANINLMINEYSNELRELRKIIKEKLSSNKSFMTKIYNQIYKYCSILGIENKIKKTDEFIFTDKLKCYSGTILHKLVISFKIALHKIVEEEIGCNIPFIIDSPSGREIKKDTIVKIMDLIKKELPNTQLIIASINNYIDVDNIINFSNQAIEKHEHSI